MNWVLNEVEIRVIGALIEKAVTTPDYYPMTLNGLTNACNQKSNRDPVVSFTEEMVVRALDGLRDKKLAVMFSEAGGRVPKYGHEFSGLLHLSEAEEATLCVLMLRGPQTAGEIKTRCGRLHEFASPEHADATLDGLIERGHSLVQKLPRQPGRREPRYTQLLGGEVEIVEAEFTPAPEAATVHVREENERLDQLAAEVERLRAEIAAMRAEFDVFRTQFE